MTPIITVPSHPEVDDESVKKQIMEILLRGKIVRFTHKFAPITKDVNEWNADELGDLTAFRRDGGATNYICPYVSNYTISEIDN